MVVAVELQRMTLPVEPHPQVERGYVPDQQENETGEHERHDIEKGHMRILDPTDWSERIGDDQDPLRYQLLAARAWGVSPRRFLGWEPAVRYERDVAGRIVASITEPEWSDADRAMVMALADYEAGLCQGCRDRLSETTKPENEFAYRPGLAIRCHKCTASLRGAEVYRDSPQAGALMIPIART